MRIEDFPRPRDDNGRGVHWSARLYHDAVYPSQDHWVDQLRAMKIKWVKLLDDGGGSGIPLAQKLLAADIMPVIRIFMAQLNPSTLGGRELDTVSRYVAIGVRYFESNNEPDLPAEWRNNQMPDNWLDIVVDNFIRDADGVLGRGGLLALPAMGPGSRDNPISLVVQKGRRDIFENGCWVAIHNYTLNHPLDYPGDAVNQLGQPLTQAEYDAYARWQYSHLTYDQIVAMGVPLSRDDYAKYNRWAWDARSMEMVNQVRAANKRPGSTVYDDPNCFRGYEAAGKMIHDALGFYVPVISTEGGPVVGWGDDNRYAKVNPTTQREWQVGITRFLQTVAPPWYFSCCTWLLASRPLGDFNPTWEQMSWYTHAWDMQFGLDGELPIVQALKDEPSVIRPEIPAGASAIQGTIRQANGQPISGMALRLLGPHRDMPTFTNAVGGYGFAGLAAGVYRIKSGDLILLDNIALGANATQQVDLTLTEGHQSSILGQVCDTGGAPKPGLAVTVGTGQQQIATVQTGSDGRYAVTGLGAGSYWVITGDGAAAVAGIQLDGWNSRTVPLTVPAPPGYRYSVVTKRLLPENETGNDRKFYGRVLDSAGQGLNSIELEMSWEGADPGTQFPRVTTPKDFTKPAGNYEFLHSPGTFMISVVEGDWPSEVADELVTVNVPGREGDPITYEVVFQLQPTGSPGTGRLSGVISNGAGLGLTLWQGAGAGQPGQRSWATVLPADGSYSFTALPAGRFTLTLEGLGAIHELDLADGASAAFNYAVGGGPTTGALEGIVRTDSGEPAAGRQVQVSRDGVATAEATTNPAGEFRFAILPAGMYQVAVDGAGVLAESVAVAAGQTTTLTLTLPTPISQKPLPAYTLFSASPQAKQLLGLALPYLRANGLAAGSRLAEAMQANAVTIVGGEDMISAADEQALRDAGCQVQRLPGDPFALAEALDL